MKFFELIPTPLNFLMTMDYSPWLEREIWPFLKVTVSPKPKQVTPIKIGVHTFDIDPYLHKLFELIPIGLNFLMTMDYSPWSEREIWPFLKVTVSPKPKRSRPPKLVCMHLTSIPILHEFFEPIPID